MINSPREKAKMPVISIEGCVAAGKSTVLEHIKSKREDWVTMQEPLQRFESALLSDGTTCNFLRDFYESGRDGGAGEKFRQLQMQVITSLLERYQSVTEVDPDTVVVLERSIQAARRVFLENGRDLLSVKDFTQLSDLCLTSEAVFEKDLKRVYLRVSEYDMLVRLQSRSRPSERNISFSNMLRLQRRMDEWGLNGGFYAVVDTQKQSASDIADTIIAMFA